MAGWELLPRIMGLLAAAAASGLVLRKLGQNVIVGYLLAGLLLGPTGVGLVRAAEDVEILSELGVALLLFAIGLEFSFARLRQLGNVAAVAGSFQILVTAFAVFVVATMLGVPKAAANALGMAFAMSSTAVVLRELTDRAQIDSGHGRNAIAILLLQDVAVIPVLILTDALSHSVDAVTLAEEVLLRGVLVLGFVLAAWAIARYVLPRAFRGAAVSGSRELPVVIAVTTSVGAAWGAHSLGFSPSLGAFAAGIVLAESPFATQIRADVTPLSAVFVTLFFASVGTAVNLPLSAGYLGSVLLLAFAVMVGKSLITATGVWMVQRSFRNAVITGIVVSQVGEFTFVISTAAYRNGVMPESVFQMALAISLATLIATPYAIGLAPRLATRLLRRFPLSARAAIETPVVQHKWARMIVIGYGPAGQAVVHSLSENAVPFLILEMNPNTVAAHCMAMPIELGDATQNEVLQHAGVGACMAIVITLPDPTACRLITNAVKRLAPGVPILSRLRYHQYGDQLRHAGADVIVDEEQVVGERLAEQATTLAVERRLA